MRQRPITEITSMGRQAPPNDAKAAARRRRRAADTARWRSRRRRGVELYKIEAGPHEYKLAQLFGGLREDQMNDKTAVASALGRLLRRGIVALLGAKKVTASRRVALASVMLPPMIKPISLRLSPHEVNQRARALLRVSIMSCCCSVASNCLRRKQCPQFTKWTPPLHQS